MNIANQLTLLRVGLVPVFIACLMIETYWGYLLGLLVFIGAVMTDRYDGKLARERGLVTDFGKFMDPLADKLLMSAAFVYFVTTKPAIPAWIVIVILGREFMVTGLRTLAAAKGRVMAADFSGKLKTVAQMTFVITLLVLMTARKAIVAFTTAWTPAYDFYLQVLSHVLILVTMALTVYSGYQYIRKNTDLFLDALA